VAFNQTPQIAGSEHKNESNPGAKRTKVSHLYHMANVSATKCVDPRVRFAWTEHWLNIFVSRWTLSLQVFREENAKPTDCFVGASRTFSDRSTMFDLDFNNGWRRFWLYTGVRDFVVTDTYMSNGCGEADRQSILNGTFLKGAPIRK
jgi:hypothetical protein